MSVLHDTHTHTHIVGVVLVLTFVYSKELSVRNHTSEAASLFLRNCSPSQPVSKAWKLKRFLLRRARRGAAKQRASRLVIWYDLGTGWCSKTPVCVSY